MHRSISQDYELVLTRPSPVLARAEQLTTRAVSPSQILQVTHITGAGDKTHGPPGRENPIVDTYSRAEFRKSGEDNNNERKHRQHSSGGHQTIHAAPGFLGSYQGL